MSLTIKEIQDLKFKLQYFYKLLNLEHRLCLEMYIKFLFSNESEISFYNYVKILNNIELKSRNILIM
jgi:hypothetical protein